jgi:hypothetical protein
MTDNKQPNGAIGLILGGVFAIAAAFFVLTGGGLGGKKTVQSDADMPPIASGTSGTK